MFQVWVVSYQSQVKYLWSLEGSVKLMTEGLYSELKDTNVNVSVVFPGATATNITEDSEVGIPEAPKDDQSKTKFSNAISK